MNEDAFDWTTSETAIRQRVTDNVESVIKIDVTMKVVPDKETTWSGKRNGFSGKFIIE